ncbi:MAG: hypothetical protein F6J86_04245 [Symploca sp. SIO1B1]|nr:hypothetical protein [Symploca sp. SIO1B1]
MLNLSNYLKLHQSVVAALMFCSVMPLAAVAEIPLFVDEEGSLAAESEFPSLQQQVFPFAESEFIDSNSNEFRKYLLGPGDRLEINVFGFEEFTELLEVIPLLMHWTQLDNRQSHSLLIQHQGNLRAAFQSWKNGSVNS